MQDNLSRLFDGAIALALFWVAWRSWRGGRAWRAELPSRGDGPLQFYAFVGLFILCGLWSAAQALRLWD
jgi:hypothetical protein